MVKCTGANSKKIVLSMFTVIGLIFMVVGTVICLNVFDYSDKVETTAIITEFESYQEYTNGRARTRHKTHITYNVEGSSYTNVVKMYSSSWNVGDEIEIYYDINNPQNVGSKDTDWALLVIPCLGLMFFCLGSITLFVSRKKQMRT
jgi:hypothetical protein